MNSKAQLRIPLDRLLPYVPPVLHEKLKASRYYAHATSTLLIQSDESRKQSDNKNICYAKLKELLLNIGRQVVPGETSLEQKERVNRLQRQENEARLRMKKHLSVKKASRSSKKQE